jgi:hypothetical protein
MKYCKNYYFYYYNFLGEGVILIGGQSGNEILDSLYELKGLSSSWRKLPQHLKTPRRFHIALSIPAEIVTECFAGILTILAYFVKIHNSFFQQDQLQWKPLTVSLSKRDQLILIIQINQVRTKIKINVEQWYGMVYLLKYT